MSTPEVTPFHSQLPVKLSFGDGAIAGSGDVLASLGAGSAFVVVEEPMVGNGASSRGAALRRERHPPGALPQALGRADARRGRRGRRAIREDTCEAIVGIGGGSALDLAKAARLVADQGGPVARFSGARRPLEPCRDGRSCWCPTTAGTGAEVSGASVLTDSATRPQERDRNGRSCAPTRARRPVLTLGLPPGPTAHTGVDALAQAIGGTHRARRQPALAGLRPRGGAPRRSRAGARRRDGSDVDARREMALGSVLAGLAMNLSDCSADHSLGQAIGQLLGLPHGLTDRPRAGRDAGPSARRLRRLAWSAWPTRSASPTTARATARAPCAPCTGSWGTSRSRPRPRPGVRAEHVDEPDAAGARGAGLLPRLRLPRLVARRGRRRLP